LTDEFSGIATQLAAGGTLAGEPVAVIAYAGMPKTDVAALQHLYSGRSADRLALGNPGQSVGRASGPLQDEEQSTAYWLARRYIGKGAPPKELADLGEVLDDVRNTPGAVGYLPLSSVPSGVNVI